MEAERAAATATAAAAMEAEAKAARLAAAAERKAQKDTEDAARNARIALKRQGTKSLITADLD